MKHLACGEGALWLRPRRDLVDPGELLDAVVTVVFLVVEGRTLRARYMIVRQRVPYHCQQTPQNPCDPQAVHSMGRFANVLHLDPQEYTCLPRTTRSRSHRYGTLADAYE